MSFGKTHIKTKAKSPTANLKALERPYGKSQHEQQNKERSLESKPHYYYNNPPSGKDSTFLFLVKGLDFGVCACVYCSRHLSGTALSQAVPLIFLLRLREERKQKRESEFWRRHKCSSDSVVCNSFPVMSPCRVGLGDRSICIYHGVELRNLIFRFFVCAYRTGARG